MNKITSKFGGFTAIMILFGFFSILYAQDKNTKILAEPVSVKDEKAPAPPKPMETPPPPRSPKSAIIPSVKEMKLKNGMTVAVIERKSLPVVTVQLLILAGANAESADQAGLANMTASLLTKGTTTRTASQIAEEIEFLGGSINTGASWNNSVVSIDIMSDKLEQALAIMSDVVLNPSFKQEEIELLKSQTLDGLTFNLKQPGFLANYVTSKYSYKEHPAGGTPESLNAITQQQIVGFKSLNYRPYSAVLIFAGDIDEKTAVKHAEKFFGKWSVPKNSIQPDRVLTKVANEANPNAFKRMLVIDLPNSGQASVNYLKNISEGRGGGVFYPASVLNSVLGGGYSSRLNQEIRIKRGLSYGAGSSFAWRVHKNNFGARTQTKNESAAEVAELIMSEINRLTDSSISEAELTPRKSVITGNFGRNLETTGGLANALADLYTFQLPLSEMNTFTNTVQAVNDSQIRDFAKANILGGDIVIVGDYAKFKDDLAKRFPNVKVEIVKAEGLDLKNLK